MKQLVKFKRKQPEEGQASYTVCEAPEKEPPLWQRVAYQLDNIPQTRPRTSGKYLRNSPRHTMPWAMPAA